MPLPPIGIAAAVCSLYAPIDSIITGVRAAPITALWNHCVCIVRHYHPFAHRSASAPLSITYGWIAPACWHRQCACRTGMGCSSYQPRIVSPNCNRPLGPSSLSRNGLLSIVAGTRASRIAPAVAARAHLPELQNVEHYLSSVGCRSTMWLLVPHSLQSYASLVVE
ncbi:hypothetical protein DFH06DRAFT_1158562 [Mycena polygramma]|nr:hypothetical protein DFH06DRAFT_1158562 [Mycena polygramma]